MRGLLWSSKNHKSTDEQEAPKKSESSRRSVGGFFSHSTSSTSLRHSTSGLLHSKSSQSNLKSGASKRSEARSQASKRQSTVNPSRKKLPDSSNHTNLASYISSNNRNSRSNLVDESPSAATEIDTAHPYISKTHVLSRDSITSIQSARIQDFGSTSQSSFTPHAYSSDKSRISVSTCDKRDDANKSSNAPYRIGLEFSPEDYDNTIFMVGWINRSHGQVLNNSPTSKAEAQRGQKTKDGKSHMNERSSVNQDYSGDSVGSTDDTVSNIEHNYPSTVPDYRLYKAQLRGGILSLYKSGMNNAVKFFDHSLTVTASSSTLQTASSSKLLANSTNSSFHSNTSRENIAHNQKEIELRYMHVETPHPDLIFNEDKKIVQSSVEGLCHTILFTTSEDANIVTNETEKSLDPTTATDRYVINLLLMAPMLDHYVLFLKIFNRYGSNAHQISSKVKNKSTITNSNVISQVENLLTERLALVVKTTLDVFPGFLLDEEILQALISILDTLSLHDDKISSKLKVTLANTHSEFSKLVLFSRPQPLSNTTTSNQYILQEVTDPEKFLLIDVDKFTDEQHNINLKFDNLWSPKLDYSLLYNSKYLNTKLFGLNPLVFDNNHNLHMLGRLFVSHIFPNDSTKIHTSPQLRAKIISKWVETGCKFEKLGDMISWLAIATVMCSIPILRLNLTWQFVPEVTLKIIFRDWIPTIIQLNRRQISAKPSNSVFILAPPDLDDEFIRNNVISYFGDLIIHADELPQDSKLNFLEKKINRTKNAFHKWQLRLEGSDSRPAMKREYKEIAPDKSVIYQYWKHYLDIPPMNLDSLMKLSLKYEEPSIDQSVYSKIGTHRTPLLTGSYLPILFNDLLANYAVFPKDSLIGAAGVSSAITFTKPIKSLPNSISIHGPSMMDSGDILSNMTSTHENSDITGIEKIDGKIVKDLSARQSNKQLLLTTIRDIFNIDTDLFHISNKLIFKSINEDDTESRPGSLVLETPKRFSLRSSVIMSGEAIPFQEGRVANDNSGKLFDNMDLFSSMSKSEGIKEMQIPVVLKSATLDSLFDLLVLTANIFSRFIDPTQVEMYYKNKETKLRKSEMTNTSSMGLLDYAIIRLQMDADTFTATFFNTYKSFTTVNTVLNNLAMRFIGAPSCAHSICSVLETLKEGNNKDSKSALVEDQSFPQWDLKIQDEVKVDYITIVKIQIGATEALAYLVKNNYNDFADDLSCNSLILDILKIMEQECTVEWARRLEKASSKFDKTELLDLEAQVDKLKSLYSAVRDSYQKQLYKPIGLTNAQRKVAEVYQSMHRISTTEYRDFLEKYAFDDKLICNFRELEFNSYEAIVQWVGELDGMISYFFNLVSKKEWFTFYQQLELLSMSSLTSFFNYGPQGRTSNQINSGSPQLQELEITNVFTWLINLRYQESEMPEGSIFARLPKSIQLLMRLHTSLTTFFTVEIASAKNHENRKRTCQTILQILNYARWKNSSLDLFDNDAGNHEETISPHIPSFLETSITIAISAPSSRCFELSWKKAHSTLSSRTKVLESIGNILEDIDVNHIRNFLEIDNIYVTKCKNITPCPGWFTCRLLEISQFVPNMSTTNTKLINFDKRRFTNNLIHNVLDLVPPSTKDHNWVAFGKPLLFIVDDSSKAFLKTSRNIALNECKLEKYQETGLFNAFLASEVEKIKNEHKKLEGLSSYQKEIEHLASQQIPIQKRESITIPPATEQEQEYNQMPSTSINNLKTKRSSVALATTKGSHTGVGRRIGGFLRRPFSIAGFNTSSSNYSLNSVLALDSNNSKAVPPSALPQLSLNDIPDGKPILGIKTFEIKNILEVINHKNCPQLMYSFKLFMQDGSEYLMQTRSSSELMNWIRMIKASKRYSYHSKKFKGQTHNKVFGVPLEDVCEREGTVIPSIVVKLLEELELRGLDEIGLYRIPGSVGSINALKKAFDEEGALNNTFTLEDDRWFEINAIAGCFKMYLRELPNSLFTNEKLNDFTEITRQLMTGAIDQHSFEQEISSLLRTLPACYFETMKRIVIHLHKVHQNVSKNRMDASNLAIVFSMSFIDQDNLVSSMGPTLGAVQTILQQFIKRPELFFN